MNAGAKIFWLSAVSVVALGGMAAIIVVHRTPAGLYVAPAPTTGRLSLELVLRPAPIEKPDPPPPAPPLPVRVDPVPISDQQAPAEPTVIKRDLGRLALARGAQLLHSGDLSGARLYYEFASQNGSQEARDILARLCDPAFLRERGVRTSHAVACN